MTHLATRWRYPHALQGLLAVIEDTLEKRKIILLYDFIVFGTSRSGCKSNVKQSLWVCILKTQIMKSLRYDQDSMGYFSIST